MPSGAPAGLVPFQTANPFSSVSVAWLFTPIKEYLDQIFPFSADSSKKVPGRSYANFRYKDNAVSPSANSLRVTGITLKFLADSRNSSKLMIKSQSRLRSMSANRYDMRRPFDSHEVISRRRHNLMMQKLPLGYFQMLHL